MSPDQVKSHSESANQLPCMCVDVSGTLFPLNWSPQAELPPRLWMTPTSSSNSKPQKPHLIFYLKSTISNLISLTNHVIDGTCWCGGTPWEEVLACIFSAKSVSPKSSTSLSAQPHHPDLASVMLALYTASKLVPKVCFEDQGQ